MKLATAIAPVAIKLAIAAGIGMAIAPASHALPDTNVTHHDVWMGNDGNVYRDVVLLSEFPAIDSWPVCEVEDCSDHVGQIGVWTDRDTGNAYVEIGEEQTYLVVDDYAQR